MYNGYITECAPMGDFFWQFVNLKYPDDPEELHEISSAPLKKLNEQLKAITAFFRELSDDDDLVFNSFDSFIGHVLDNYPPDIDPDVLDLYLNNLEIVVELITNKFVDDIIVLDRIGSVAILQE